MRRSDALARQRDASLALYALLGELTGLERDDRANQTESVLEAGVALSALSAAECVVDFPRTAAFLNGLDAAVARARSRFPDEPIEILYAGCGPFALLALPLALTSDDVRFTMLDAHARSIELARGLFETLGIGGRVDGWLVCDAATYVHPPNRALHVVVSETMRRALETEPQVAITLNLAAQLSPGGIFVPERIAIGAYLDDLDAEKLRLTEDLEPAPERGRDRPEVELGTVFELSAATAPPSPAGAFPPITLEVPAYLGAAMHLVLSTRIRVFGEVALDDYESGLTYPKVLRTLDRVRPGSRIRLQYILGREPRFHVRCSPQPAATPGTRSINR